MSYLQKHGENTKIILRVTIIVIVANIILVAAKLVAGVLYGNLAVLSDAIHSASDLITSFFIIIAVFIASPKRDKKHNYGHEKIESLFVLFFGVVLVGVGVFLMWQGIEGIISPRYAELNWFLLGVTIFSLVVKEALFWYGMHYAKKTKSDLLRADAWHSRSDSLTSVAVLVGLVCSSFMRTNLIESIAVIIVALFIFKVAFDISRPAINQLIDKAADVKDIEKITKITSSIDGVIAIDNLQTRIFGSGILVDLEICVDKNLTVAQGHDIGQQIHDKLESDPDLRIKHCNVHVNPEITVDTAQE